MRNTRAGARVILHMEQYGTDGGLAAEHWWTIFFPGCDELADVGPEPPDHTFPEAARGHLVGSVTQHVDADIATRYAEVSNDWSAHHFDRESSAAGSMVSTTCSPTASARWRCARRPQVGMMAGGDPSRDAPGAECRYLRHPLDSTPTSPSTCTTRARVEERAKEPKASSAFEATGAGAAVIKHGRIELFS